MLTRRDALTSIAGGLAAGTFATPVRSSEQRTRSALGLVVYNCARRRQWLSEEDSAFDLYEPLTFLKHCHDLGAGGMQAPLGVMEAERVRSLRDYAVEHGLFIEAIVTPPADRSDVDRFDAEIRTAAEAGALAARTVIIPGRRYERFETLAEFREFEARGERMLELAVPIVERHRVPLAVENHKDQRNDERVALLKRIDSEYVGACVDTGNSFALLEDPIETIEVLAPWAFSVHLKDQAVREYEEGFLLGDIPLGEGCLDLKRMVEILRQARPKLRFVLELITRDPLRVPCLTEQYWATLPDVPGSDLARTLRIVRRHRAESLQEVSSLSLKEQVALEDANIASSLKYARENLGL
jgi:3-oxoisoapionate decarboxylase